MDKFTTLESAAIPLMESDVDTDVIFPARFLLLLDRRGLGKYLFHGRRQAAAATERFVLDQPEYEGASILVAGERFGVGSSREHAVWALADFGIRCVIAPSFGDIFHANCLKNGVLPIRLDGFDLDRVGRIAKAATSMRIDLPRQVIELPEGSPIAFEIEAGSKHALLNGLDEIDMILAEDTDAITAFEKRQKAEAPWLWLEESVIERLETPVAPGRTK